MSVERGIRQHQQTRVISDRASRLRPQVAPERSERASGERYAAVKERGKGARGEDKKQGGKKQGGKKQGGKIREGQGKDQGTSESTQDKSGGARGQRGSSKRESRGAQSRRDTKRDKKGRAQRGQRGTKGRRGKKREGGRSFAVWRAVTLFPRPSLDSVLSGFIYLCCACYAVILAYQAHTQLQVNLNAQGLKRTFYARSPIAVPLPADEPPVIGQLIDQREISLWRELKRRSGFDLKSEPPLITHPDPQVNKGAWYNALRDRKVEFIESQGVGDAGEPSLLWPPLPAPQPTLIVGHAFDKIAWIHPQRGVVLSHVPPSWQRATSYRLPPETSRRW